MSPVYHEHSTDKEKKIWVPDGPRSARSYKEEWDWREVRKVSLTFSVSRQNSRSFPFYSDPSNTGYDVILFRLAQPCCNQAKTYHIVNSNAPLVKQDLTWKPVIKCKPELQDTHTCIIQIKTAIPPQNPNVCPNTIATLSLKQSRRNSQFSWPVYPKVSICSDYSI